MRDRSSSSFLAAAIAATLAAAPAFAQSPAKSLSERSFARARDVLESALAAAGGRAALLGVRDVTRKGTGTVYNQGQSLVPEPPYTTRVVEVTSVVDFANRKSATETATTPQGGVPGKARAVLAGEAGFALNLVTNVLTPSTPGGVAGLRTAVRRDPAALLLTLASRADALRYLGEDSFAGAPHHVLAFADSDGTQIAVYVDGRTSLVSKYETLADSPVLGDTLSEVVFSDYRAVDGVKLPFRVVSRTAGEDTQDLKYTEVRVNVGSAPALFQAPPDPVAGLPTGPTGAVVVRKLADDVYLAEGSSHHSLFVAFADHVVLVEAPQNEERVAAVLARIRETVPGKPVRYVVPTHHHFDHSGGLRAAVAAGATVITTPGNKAFIEQMARTAHTVRPDALSRAAATPKVETFTGRRVLTDGTRTLELHDIGPNPHVKEAVIAYLPREKMAFQADLIGLPAQGPLPPASPATVDFVQKVRQRGLQVDTIVGSHGRVGTMDEVVKAVEAQATVR